MPFTLEQQAALVRVTLSGAVDIADLAALGEALDQIDRETPGLDRLVEADAVTSVALDFVTMARFAEARARWSPAEGVRTAILAPTNETYGFARMFQDLSRQPIAVQVFRSREQALAWLGERPAAIPPHSDQELTDPSRMPPA